MAQDYDNIGKKYGPTTPRLDQLLIAASEARNIEAFEQMLHE